MAEQAPSQAELVVLKQLWASGEQSAREVHERVAESTDWSYSTTRTLLARMVQKGLVIKRDSHGLALYVAGEEKVSLIGKMVKSFSRKVLELDGSLPVSAFSDSKLLDESELDELSRLLEEDEND